MKNQGNNLQRDPFWDVTTGKLSQWQHRVEFVLKSRAERQIPNPYGGGATWRGKRRGKEAAALPALQRASPAARKFFGSSQARSHA